MALHKEFFPSYQVTGRAQIQNSMFTKSECKSLAWNKIPAQTWSAMQQNVFRTQNRIYKASLLGKTNLVHWLQRRLVFSLDARFIAYRRVLTSGGKNTPGTDGIAAEELKNNIGNAVLSLCLDGKSSPIRRVWIPKPGKTEKRPLGIPTLEDKAKQALALLALEPEWESKFEPNSYGFRKARGCHDAIEAVFQNLKGQKKKWVFNADIKKCFDRINHDALLSKLATFPEMEKQVRAWLKAGILEEINRENITESPEIGTPQGGGISPLLANVALHGLENILNKLAVAQKGAGTPGANSSENAKLEALGVIRYADDFIIAHANESFVKLCIEEAKAFLLTMGLEINEEKSRLIPGTEGFKFLGFSIIQVIRNGKQRVKISPSKEKEKLHQLKIREILQRNKSSPAAAVITKLAPVVTGWANYYKYCECDESFQQMDYLMYQKLRAWVHRRSSRKGIMELMDRYFPSGQVYTYKGVKHQDEWVFAEAYQKVSKKGTPKKSTVAFLPKHAWTHATKFTKVPETKSYYDGD